MTILERVASLEAKMDMILKQLERIVAYDMQLIFVLIAGLAAVAFLIIKKKD